MADKLINEEKDKGGRPPIVMTNEEIAELQTLAAVLNQEQIAEYFDFSVDTLERLFKRQPEVRRAYKKGRIRALAGVGGNLIKQSKTNPAAAIFYMKCQGGWKEPSNDQSNAAEQLASTFARMAENLPD